MAKGCQVYLWRCVICGTKSYGKHPPTQCEKCFGESNKYILLPHKEEDLEDTENGLDVAELNNILYIVGSTLDGRMNAMCCSSVTQVTYSPPMVAVAVNKNNLTHDFIKESGAFTLCPLSKSQLELAYHFGRNTGRKIDKFEKMEPKVAKTGSPIVQMCPGYYDCEVNHKATMDLTSHTVFVGNVQTAQQNLKEPLLTYYDYIKEVRNTIN